MTYRALGCARAKNPSHISKIVLTQEINANKKRVKDSLVPVMSLGQNYGPLNFLARVQSTEWNVTVNVTQGP